MQELNYSELFFSLKEFQSASLTEIESARLLDRYDIKYAFDITHLFDILKELIPYYKILDIDGKRIFTYNNIYFDTDDYRLHNNHHNGKQNRFKVRLRHYMELDSLFFEIKFRTNKEKTIKKRVQCTEHTESIPENTKKLLLDTCKIDSESLGLKLRINYNRITLIHKENPEKITFDLNLHFINCLSEKDLPGIVVAELKQNSPTQKSFFKTLMKSMKICEVRMSKYCLGNVLTNSEVKYNRFKQKLMIINKIQSLEYARL